MPSGSISTCHPWVHRIRGRVMRNDVTCFEFTASRFGTESIVSGICSGCGADPCEDYILKFLRRIDQQWQEYRFLGINECMVRVVFIDRLSQPLTIMQITRCEVCNSDNHPTIMCLRLLDVCFVGECPFCASSQHDIGGCPMFTRMDLTQQIQVLVADRAGLPPLGKGFPCWDYLHRWMHDPVSGNKILSGFPWSESFTNEITSREGGQYVKRLQDVFDKDFDRSLLPVDESTRTINGVYTNLWCPANVRGWVERAESSNQ